MEGFQQTITFNGKPLREVLVFADSYRGGEKVNGLWCALNERNNRLNSVQVWFDEGTDSILQLEMVDGKIVDCHITTDCANFTFEDLNDSILCDYDVKLEEWQLLLT